MSVVYPYKGKTIRWSTRACFGAITCSKDFFNPRGGPVSAPNLNKRAHNISHHVVQECITTYIKGDELLACLLNAAYLHKLKLAGARLVLN